MRIIPKFFLTSLLNKIIMYTYHKSNDKEYIVRIDDDYWRAKK